MAPKNYKQVKTYLTPAQEEFLNLVVDVIKRKIDPGSTISRSDVIRYMIGRFAEEPAPPEAKIISKALSYVSTMKNFPATTAGNGLKGS